MIHSKDALTANMTVVRPRWLDLVTLLAVFESVCPIDSVRFNSLKFSLIYRDAKYWLFVDERLTVIHIFLIVAVKVSVFAIRFPVDVVLFHDVILLPILKSLLLIAQRGHLWHFPTYEII